MSIRDAVGEGELHGLMRVRDELAARLDGDVSDRDFGALVLRLESVLKRISELQDATPGDVSLVDEIRAKRERMEVKRGVL